MFSVKNLKMIFLKSKYFVICINHLFVLHMRSHSKIYLLYRYYGGVHALEHEHNYQYMVWKFIDMKNKLIKKILERRIGSNL